MENSARIHKNYEIDYQLWSLTFTHKPDWRPCANIHPCFIYIIMDIWYSMSINGDRYQIKLSSTYTTDVLNVQNSVFDDSSEMDETSWLQIGWQTPIQYTTYGNWKCNKRYICKWGKETYDHITDFLDSEKVDTI